MNAVEKLSYKSIINEKNYLMFIIANAISRFGDSVDLIAFEFMVLQVTGSPSLMALLLGVNTIPNIIIQPFAGPVVDYVSKKKIIAYCDFGRGLIVLLTAVLYMLGIIKTPMLFVFTLINSSLESFTMPATFSIVTEILPKEKYAYGESTLQTISKVIEMVGLGIAGTIIAIFGVGTGIIIDAISFLVSSFIILFIKINKKDKKQKEISVKTYFENLKKGFALLINNKLIFNIALFMAMINILLVPINTLATAYVRNVLSLGAQGVSCIMLSLQLGLALGSFIYPKINKKVKGIYIIVISGIMLGSFYSAYYYITCISNNILLELMLITISAFVGFSTGILIVKIHVAIMDNVENEVLARVSSIISALAMIATPLGSFLVSIFCNVVAIDLLFFIVGIITVVFFIIQLFNKSIQKI